MATLSEKIGGAVLEVEGDPEACSWAQARFHLMLAEERLKALETEIAPLLRQRRGVQKYIRLLKARAEGVTASAQPSEVANASDA